MHLLQAINSDRQTRLLNVFGQIAVFWEIKEIKTDGTELPTTDASNRCLCCTSNVRLQYQCPGIRTSLPRCLC